MLLHIGRRVGVLVKDGCKDLHGSVAVDLALLDQRQQLDQCGRRKGHLFGFDGLLLQGAQHLAHHPVGHVLGGAAQPNGLLKEVGQRLLAGQHTGIVLRQAELGHIARLLLRGHLGQFCPGGVQVLLGDLHGRDVRLREVAVILGVLLGAHGVGGVLVLVPAAGLLDHPLAVLDQLDLAAGLIGDGPGNGLEGVDVLHLGAGAQLRAPGGADREVHVAAEGALLHLAVGHAQILQRGLQLLQIGDDLLGGAEVRLSDDLDQRHAAAVVVRPGLVDPRVVHQLAGILLHVHLVDADDLFLAAGQPDGHLAVGGDGQVELRDLVCLGQVGVEVVLAVELVVASDVAVQRQSGLGRIAHDRLVHNGQCAGHTGAHRAAVGVGRAAEGGGAGAEDLRPGGQLHMGLQADHSFPSHVTSPPLLPGVWYGSRCPAGRRGQR